MTPESPTPPTTAPPATTPPATPEEALAIVRSRYAQPKWPDGTPAPLHVHEFDIGYLVYATFPRTTGTDAAGNPVPPPPGGANIVVAKDTGETTTVPNFPPESAVALYRKSR
ncbi:hypothetical protein AB0I10_15445 [Streptomyces sp. NPDC050636]|uniref:hypothetical protein n=1 Tax=Streptomyces sp. NPDC050636 TaxID=3154510 RepID=UPI003424FCEA